MSICIVREMNAARLSSLGSKTFSQAFRELNNPEDFDAYLAHAFSLETIDNELSDSRADFFVAFNGDEPLGYYKLYAGSAPDCVAPLPAVELARFYVLKSEWGKGVGPAMMQQVLNQAREKGFAALWLSSWQKNHRGNTFYGKWGFHIIGEKTFTIGRDVQEDFILRRVL
jgi:GNAT superfamily N-acetyltransferase